MTSIQKHRRLARIRRRYWRMKALEAGAPLRSTRGKEPNETDTEESPASHTYDMLDALPDG